jgi:hypothetical protein
MLYQKEINMPRTVFLYVLLISLLVAGCTAPTTREPASTPTASNPPALDGEWTVYMTHSGGIMGLSRSIEVSSDGKFTVVDERENKTTTGQLTTDELAKINEQVMSFEYIPASKPGGMACADCFIYDLEIQRDGKRFAAQLSDVSLPGSGLESLVSYLRELIDTALR